MPRKGWGPYQGKARVPLRYVPKSELADALPAQTPGPPPPHWRGRGPQPTSTASSSAARGAPPAPPGPPAEFAGERREDAPLVRPYTRGSFARPMQIARSETLREEALAALWAKVRTPKSEEALNSQL